jgi:hypothetical protein
MKKLYILGVAMAALLAGCEPSTPDTATKNAVSVEQNQQRLQNVIPAPALQTSIERKNLVKRLERLNTENMAGYIYLISRGSVVSFYPIAGKPTSLNAYLMAGERVIRPYSGDCCGPLTVEQPDYDGAYGKNADGIFFFTADTDAYVEWYGEYLFSDQPLRLSQQPLMVREVKD